MQDTPTLTFTCNKPQIADSQPHRVRCYGLLTQSHAASLLLRASGDGCADLTHG